MGVYLGQTLSVRTVWTEHQAILSAVVRGDARMAERLAREHCEASAQIILRHLFEKAPSPSATTQPVHRRQL
jgi:DNA-binding GntR family transcriptional regulator